MAAAGCRFGCLEGETTMRARVLVVVIAALVCVSTTQHAGAQARGKTITRAQLERVLGGQRAPIRVVRTAGVADLAGNADSVHLAPGEFVFRKMGDTARRVERANAASPLQPSVRDLSKAAAFAMPYRWLT